MAKSRRTTARRQRTVEDVQQEIAQLELQKQLLDLDIQKLQLELRFMQNGTVKEVKQATVTEKK